MSAAERRWNARGLLQILAVVPLLLVLRGLFLPEPAWAQPSGPLVSVEAQSEDVRQVLQQLAATAGINLVVDDSLTPRITLKLQNVPLDQALQSIAKAAGATIIYDGAFIFSSTVAARMHSRSRPPSLLLSRCWTFPRRITAWRGN
ncbi:MAG: hypothetical protein IMX01_09140 [Limnochordaceae bacterium]|nr:hypothetical protein [Limnochordaceae bacterium]